jgi:2'-5' RNA ligase
MAKPIGGPLAQIHALPRTSPERSSALTYATLFRFFDLATEPAQSLSTLQRLMDRFYADAFHVRLDQIRERGAVMLFSRAPLCAAAAFQRGLMTYFTRCGFDSFGKSPKLHVTVNYCGDGQGNEAIDPIAWMIDEVLLIESIHGQATHHLHGRWELDRLLI